MENEPGSSCSIREMIKKSAMSLMPMKKAYGMIVFHGVRGAESPGLSAGVLHHLLPRNLQCLWAINTTCLV